MVKEMNKCVMRERRNFQREIFKMEMNDKKFRADLERMTKNREPMYNRKVLAQNLIRNKKFMDRYRKLDLQL